MKLKKYLKLARFDHWIKNIFIIPGVVIAHLYNVDLEVNYSTIFFVFFGACFISSANYVLNEWLDRSTDKFHPIKKERSAVKNSLNPLLVISEYFFFIFIGLALLSAGGYKTFCLGIVFILLMCLYNIKPVRLKDRVILDVLSESSNNPIRFMFGWLSVAPFSTPPASIIICYFFVGCYLMSLKRFSELRQILEISNEPPVLYRKSFGIYSEKMLLLMVVFFLASSFFFGAIFLVKYKPELILLYPFLIILFGYTFNDAFSENSAAIRPETLYSQTPVVFLVALIGVLFFYLLTINIPAISYLLQPNYL